MRYDLASAIVQKQEIMCVSVCPADSSDGDSYPALLCIPSYDDTLVVPIIENTPEEKDLKDRMARAMEEYPDSCAVLVRRHGVYVWGESWEKAKTM